MYLRKSYNVYLLFYILYILYGLSELSASSDGYIFPFIYDERNSTDCSWQFYNVHGLQTQSCIVQPHEETGETDMCPDAKIPVPNPFPPENRPREAGHLQVEEISKTIHFPERPELNGEYTCLRITFTIERNDAHNTHAIQFSIRSKHNSNSRFYCQVHEYHQIGGDRARGMGYDSVVNFSTCGIQSAQCEPKIFIYDNFCGIAPGYEYDVVVRTLPVDYNTPGLPYDTKWTVAYPYDSRVINATDCNLKPNDMRCQRSKEANWTSDIQIQQDNSRNLADIVNVTVTFSIAPQDFGFDEYRVFIYQERKYRYKFYKTIIPNDADFQDTLMPSISWLIENVSVAECYTVKVQPPSKADLCTMGIDKRTTSCPASRSEIFCPYANACSSFPCGDNGTCLSADHGRTFTCTCKDGFLAPIDSNQTCLKNPCVNESNIYKCGEHGKCNVVYGVSLSYTCSCQDGYYITNGTCVKIDQVTSTQTNADQMQQDLIKSIAAVLGSLIGVVLLIFVMMCLVKRVDIKQFLINSKTDKDPPDKDTAKFPAPDPGLGDWFQQNGDTVSISSRFSKVFDSIQTGTFDDGEQNIENNQIQQKQYFQSTYGYSSEENGRTYDSRPLFPSADQTSVDFYNAYAATIDHRPPQGTEPRTLLHSQDMYIQSEDPEVNGNRSDIPVGQYSDLQIQSAIIAVET